MPKPSKSKPKPPTLRIKSNITQTLPFHIKAPIESVMTKPYKSNTSKSLTFGFERGVQIPPPCNTAVSALGSQKKEPCPAAKRASKVSIHGA